MNIKNRHITKLTFILTITAFVIGLSACERVHQIIEPEISETDVPVRDHVWVVDQNGVEGTCPGDLGTCVTHALQLNLYNRRKLSPYRQMIRIASKYRMAHTQMGKASSGQR